MNNDYKDFLSHQEIHSSEKVSRDIYNFVNKELSPTKLNVLKKLIFLQLLIGSITLLFCPQFKMSLTANFDLFHYFHRTFGSKICMIICGAIFMTPTTIVACVILNKAEIDLIRDSRGLFSVVISMLSLLCFMLAGAKVFVAMTLFWVLGAVSIPLFIYEINYTLRKKRHLL